MKRRQFLQATAGSTAAYLAAGQLSADHVEPKDTDGSSIEIAYARKILVRYEADVAVIGVPDDKFGEALLAFVVTNPEMTLSTEEMVEFCRDKIAGYKIPRQLQIVDELPRNPSGKILKKVLREPYWEASGRGIG